VETESLPHLFNRPLGTTQITLPPLPHLLDPEDMFPQSVEVVIEEVEAHLAVIGVPDQTHLPGEQHHLSGARQKLHQGLRLQLHKQDPYRHHLQYLQPPLLHPLFLLALQPFQQAREQECHQDHPSSSTLLAYIVATLLSQLPTMVHAHTLPCMACLRSFQAVALIQRPRV